jgi:hypothetical protein
MLLVSFFCAIVPSLETSEQLCGAGIALASIALVGILVGVAMVAFRNPMFLLFRHYRIAILAY